MRFFHKYRVLLHQPFLSPYIQQGYVFIQNCFLLKMGLESLFRLPTIYLVQAFCMAPTVCFSLFIWSIPLVSGYCRWWLRMSCGCNLTIWQPHVHISMPMCLAKFTIYSQNQEPKAQKIFPAQCITRSSRFIIVNLAVDKIIIYFPKVH